MELHTTQGKPRREKLRSSCDGCASSKVRCEKQQPSCSRCQQLSQVCIYGRSRRRGKPVSRQQQAPILLEGSIHTSWDSNEALHHSMGHIDYSTWQPSTVLEQPIDGFHAAPCWKRGDILAAEIAGNSNFSGIFTSTGTFDMALPNTVANSESSQTAFSLSESPPAYFSESASSKSASLIEDTAELDSVGPNIQSCGDSSCIPNAFATLSSLYRLAHEDSEAIDGTTMKSSKSIQELSKGLSSNHVLLVAREATQKLEELLACTCVACIHEPNLFFVLFNIAIKALSWYRSLYNSNISYLNDGTSKGPNVQSSPPKPVLTHIEEMLCNGPLTVGTLHLPLETELRIRAQLMLCELQPLARACNALSLQTRRGDEDSHGEGQVQEALKSHIQRSVKELSRYLEVLCGQLD